MKEDDKELQPCVLSSPAGWCRRGSRRRRGQRRRWRGSAAGAQEGAQLGQLALALVDGSGACCRLPCTAMSTVLLRLCKLKCGNCHQLYLSTAGRTGRAGGYARVRRALPRALRDRHGRALRPLVHRQVQGERVLAHAWLLLASSDPNSCSFDPASHAHMRSETLSSSLHANAPTPTQDGVTSLERRADLLQRAEPRICAWDIETTKLPLQFPNAEYDQVCTGVEWAVGSHIHEVQC